MSEIMGALNVIKTLENNIVFIEKELNQLKKEIDRILSEELKELKQMANDLKKIYSEDVNIERDTREIIKLIRENKINEAQKVAKKLIKLFEELDKKFIEISKLEVRIKKFIQKTREDTGKKLEEAVRSISGIAHYCYLFAKEHYSLTLELERLLEPLEKRGIIPYKSPLGILLSEAMKLNNVMREYEKL